ncbi:MAG: DUF2779 domain-containing protein [Burkholderiales bacterium]|nr:DUF2779 domain-containing protein [Burkholderiales bacterium]
MRHLSKSKLLAFRQCPKRLWLEVHRPELNKPSESVQGHFDEGHRVGDIARRLYDPRGKGQLIEPKTEGYASAIARTKALLASTQPIFEATFAADGALALADVMLPTRQSGQRAWRMVEVKSSASVKGYHRDDAAIQAYVARNAGVPLASLALACIDSKWVYPGGGDYQGLLVEEDLTKEAFARASEVKAWIAEAQAIAAKRKEPKLGTGDHCNDPFECGFVGYCQGQEPQAEYPVRWLPRIQSKVLKSHIQDGGVLDMREVPDERLGAQQRRVKQHTLSGTTFFDKRGAAADLAAHKLPAYFLDFETIRFTVPIWKDTRPYQQIPFQFSVHRLARTGKVAHESFLDLSGNDPTRALAEHLIAACGDRGPVFVYNATFEKSRIQELADRFTRLKPSLLAINARVVDLLKVAQKRYYHPSQQGSWSIKKVLPTIAPDLRYDALEGVQHGGMAMQAFLQAIAPTTSDAEKAGIEQALLKYCALDTYAMVRLWQFFAGRADLTL